MILSAIKSMKSQYFKYSAVHVLGAGYTGIISLLTIPILLAKLGPIAYGFIAIMLVVKELLSVFDFGLALASRNEIARRVDVADSPKLFILSIEFVYYGIGLLLSTCLWLWLEKGLNLWMDLSTIDQEEIKWLVLYFSISFACIWPTTLYKNLLQSINEHTTHNVINALVVTLRNPVIILVLLLVSPSLKVYWFCYMLTSFVELVLYVYFVRARFDIWALPKLYAQGAREITAILSFSLGIGLSSFVSIFIRQIDRILVSRYFGLETTGYYTTILALASLLSKLAAPITRAVLPSLVRLNAEGNKNELLRVYSKHSTMIAAAAFPVAMVFITHSESILSIWLRGTANPDFTVTFVLLSFSYVLYSLSDMPIISYLVASKSFKLAGLRLIVLPTISISVYILISLYGIVGASIGVLAGSACLFVLLIFLSKNHAIQLSWKREMGQALLPIIGSVITIYLPAKIMNFADMHFVAWWVLVAFGLVGYALFLFATRGFKVLDREVN